MQAVDLLRQHAEELQRVTGLSVEVVAEGPRVCVMVRQVPLPAGRFNVAVTDLLLLADQQYPLSAMDMFWTEPEVVRANGSVPRSADAIEQHLGRSWRRFSWHRNGIWNPNGNPLLDHFAFVESRFTVEAA